VRKAGLLVLLGALSAFGPLTIDMYLPALPSMSDDLETSATGVQLTLIVFVAVLAVSQLLYGSVSDGVGRRPPLLLGLTIFVAGTVSCVLAGNIALLVVGRVVQAVGAAAATVISRAMVRDLFSGTEMTRFFSSLMLVNGAAPVLAPVIGAQLLRVWSWRSVFVALTCFGIVLLALVTTCLQESLPPERRRAISLTRQLTAYSELARDSLFMRHITATSLMFAAMFAYIAASSFVLQNNFGLSAQQFSVVFGINGLGLILLGQVNGRVVGVLAPERVLMMASLVAGCSGAIGVLTSALLGLGLWVMLPSLFVMVASVGPVLANGTSLALADHSTRAGAASSLQGLLQFLIGGTVAATMGVAGDGMHAMAVSIVICSLSALAVFSSTLRVALPAGT